MYNAFIRTHHLTSRHKLNILRTATSKHKVFVLVRSGGTPGMLYCEGDKKNVTRWVDCAHKLRYKDYQLVQRPAERRAGIEPFQHADSGRFEEVGTVRAFGARMRDMGMLQWWKTAMGFFGMEKWQD